MAAFADQVDNGPVPLTSLDVLYLKRGKFGAAQSAADQYGDHGTISLGPEIVTRNAAQQRGALLQGQPVSRPVAELLSALHAPDSCGQFGAEQAAIGGFVGEPTHRRKSLIDTRRGEAAGLQAHAEASDDDAAKREAGL